MFQVKDVDQIEKGLVQQAQRFFLLDWTDKLWQEHLQVRCPAPYCICCLAPSIDSDKVSPYAATAPLTDVTEQTPGLGQLLIASTVN